jgi:hypothetical protein
MSMSEQVLAAVESAYREHFEVEPARAAVSFLGVDEIVVLRYSGYRMDHYLTLGMSRHGMVEPSSSVIESDTGPRAELLLTASGQPHGIVHTLAVLAAAPAVEGVVYAAGNRIDLSTPLVDGSRCTGAVIQAGPLKPIQVSGHEGIVVDVLSAIPATSTELAWARVHGSEALLARWAERGTNLADLHRPAVELG